MIEIFNKKIKKIRMKLTQVIVGKEMEVKKSLNRKEKGLQFWQATLFIIGDVAGTGVLALPNAILGTGWVGILMMLVFAGMAAYAGVRLGSCWIIMEERYEECRKQVRNPYQSIALKVYGVGMKRFVSGCVILSLFGTCVVLLLLMAEMLQEIFFSVWNVSICHWAILVAAFLIPLTWLGTPKDFWPLAVLATCTVFIAAMLLLAQCILDIGIHGKINYPEPDLKGFSLSFGTLLFAFGGAAAFPTIQKDMKDCTKFPKCAAIAFLGVCLIYTPISFFGYYTYGSLVSSSITGIIRNGPLKIIAQALLLLHLMCAFVVLINPVYQEAEDFLKMPTGFSIKSCLLRTCGVILALFIGETIPHFGKILNLIGGSTSSLLTFILPCVFYMRLVGMKNPKWVERKIPLHETVFMWEIIAVGICGGIASTVTSIWDIVGPDAFSLPCYIRAYIENT